ncbi:hypothetical protein KY338_00560 [Candidatus Woesearchaeota archaeon]|nr:hypothetical protein [Candidatus Woesearchaeota archaeon]MBW3005189.1 hypothetical protein [Candidatus Woesearchaeota archaeon]
MKLRAFILLILIILVSSTVFAATIDGSIYDIELNELSNVVVEINTTPKQSFVSKNGVYSFDVPVGEYTITAKHEQGTAEERIRVNDEGKYNIDLILFPDFSEDVALLNESDLKIETFEQPGQKNYSLYYLFGFIIVMIILIAVIFNFKKKLEKKLKQEIKEIKNIKKEENLEKDLKELVAFIKKEGGRTTQKDIRTNFPQSEAKISLMVSELEHKGKIKKIKKGRGNIITLR